MENVVRQTKRESVRDSGVRLDNSATHFKNNKLSEHLEQTLETIFRKKNSARIHQRQAASKTRQDLEYLQAVKQVLREKQRVNNTGPSTSASTRRQVQLIDSQTTPDTRELPYLHKTELKTSALKAVPQAAWESQQKLRSPNLGIPAQPRSRSRSSSVSTVSSIFSQEDESDGPDANKIRHYQPPKFVCPPTAPGQFSIGNNRAIKPTSNAGRAEKGKFRYIVRPPPVPPTRRRPHPTETPSLMQTGVYDPGDVYLVSTKRHTSSKPGRKRSRTALGLVATADSLGASNRKCESASLSRRKLRDMNNIDALIKSSETPIFLDPKAYLLGTNKRYFAALQLRVSDFLTAIDDFKKRSVQQRDVSLFFLT